MESGEKPPLLSELKAIYDLPPPRPDLIACARCGGTHELESMDSPTDWRIILLQYRCGDDVFCGAIRWRVKYPTAPTTDSACS